MPNFKVVLDADLADEHFERINQSIQRAVLSEVAKIDTRGDLVTASQKIIDRREWLGFILMEARFNDLGQLGERFNEIGEKEFGR